MWDACIVAGIQSAGFPAADVTWIGELLKGQAMQEGGQGSSLANQDSNGMNGNCGGQNCGIWAISAGSVSGDNPPGPCGSGTNYSHSFGLFQDTPACEGTFIQPLPSGYTETATGSADYIPWSQTQKIFYAESAETAGVTDALGQTVKGDINAVTDPMDPQYKLSIFNPAYQLFVHIAYTLWNEYVQTMQSVPGCTDYEVMYKVIGGWLNGDGSTNCGVPNDGGGGTNGGQSELSYVQGVISNWNGISSNTFPGPTPASQ
jgi:hypothetical protein